MVSLAYLVPTIGRSTLARTVDGIRMQLSDGDQLFVIGDGPLDRARLCMQERQARNVFYLEHGPTKNWGASQIDYASQLARADYLCYLGDDDEIETQAMTLMRSALRLHPDRPHIFAMWHTDRILKGSSEMGQVSGQQIVVPNDPKVPRYSEKPRFGQAYDHHFIERVVKVWDGVVFSDHVIARLHQQSQGAMF